MIYKIYLCFTPKVLALTATCSPGTLIRLKEIIYFAKHAAVSSRLLGLTGHRNLLRPRQQETGRSYTVTRNIEFGGL